MRDRWGCDCDGVKRRPSEYKQRGVTRHLDVIESIAGARPYSCPWRAYFDPLVIEAMRIASFIESGNLAAFRNEDMPAVLDDAVSAYWAALQSVIAEERRIADEEAKRKQGKFNK